MELDASLSIQQPNQKLHLTFSFFSQDADVNYLIIMDSNGKFVYEDPYPAKQAILPKTTFAATRTFLPPFFQKTCSLPPFSSSHSNGTCHSFYLVSQLQGWWGRLGEEFKSSAERKNTKGLINIIKAAAVCYCQHNTGKRPVQIVRTLIRDYAVSAQLNGFQKDALSIHLSTGFTARLHFSLYFPTQRLLGRR